MPTHIKTLSVRIRDKHADVLNSMAFDVNQVWNSANALSAEYSYIPIPGFGWVTGKVSDYDLQKELVGIRKDRGMSIGSATYQSVIAQHAKSRRHSKKTKLKWRCSGGTKKSLGWIPFKAASVKYLNGQIRFCGKYFKLWDSYGLGKYDLGSGSFSQDSRGRWYFNTTVKVESTISAGSSSIGVDLGLTTTATCSDGVTFSRLRLTDKFAKHLAIAQRANKKARVRTIHAKIKNSRKDMIHKFTTELVNKHGAIFIGNVSSQKLVKTKMAKSVLDAGWAILKTQLKYKAVARLVVFEEVDESYTTQTCSCCGEISCSSPKGRAGLRIREWTCAKCGAMHDRDINAAKNILQRGHALLAEGIPFIEREDVKKTLRSVVHLKELRK